MSIAEKYMNRACASELFASAVCNMNCRYCYIPKNDEMHNIHKRIRAGIRDGTFYQTIHEIFGDRLECISFWGTEPTLVMDDIVETIDNLLSLSGSLKTISFSSNMLTNTNSIIELAKALDAKVKKIKDHRGDEQHFELNVQFSLDGPAYITDYNRKEGATEKIIEHVLDFFEKTKSLTFENLKISSHFKPTASIENIRHLNGDLDRIVEWFMIFEDIFDKYIEIVPEEIRPKLSLDLGATPTLVLPGEYTSEDGKEFARFVKNLYTIERENVLKWTKQLNNYEGRLSRVVRYAREIPTKTSMFTCSGGDSNFGIDILKNIHVCHRSFFMMNEEYVKAVKENLNSENWDTHIILSGRDYILRDKFTANITDLHDTLRFGYIMRNYHDFLRFRTNQVAHLVKELAMAGQASFDYAVNDDLCRIFALFINCAFSCPAENIVQTGVSYFTPVSIIRMLGNGAFETTLKEYIRREGANV